MCSFPPETLKKKYKKKKKLEQFFPPLSNLAAEDCRGCALNCACCTNNYILQFPCWVLLFAVLKIPTPGQPFPCVRTNTHRTGWLLLPPGQLISHRPACSWLPLCHMLFTTWNCSGNRLWSDACWAFAAWVKHAQIKKHKHARLLQKSQMSKRNSVIQQG